MSNAMPYPAQRKQASALLTALALLVMATSIVTMLVTVQRVSIRRTETLIDMTDAFYQTQRVEQWAISLIQQWQQDNLRYIPFPVNMPVVKNTNGEVQGTIEDWQSRFNLFALRSNRYDPLFKNFLQQLLGDIDEESAQAIIDNIRYRLQRGPSIRSISELREIDDVTAQRYQRLLPYVSLLSSATPNININSISPTFLRLLSPTITDSELNEFVQQRSEQQGFSNIGVLKTLFNEDKVDSKWFTTKTQYYLVTAMVRYSHSDIKIFTLMRATGSGKRLTLQVVWRSWNTL